MSEEKLNATAFFKSQDLTELQRQLQEMEGDLELLVREKQKEIDALKALVKMVDLFQNGKTVKERKPRAPRAASGDPKPAGQPTIVERALTYLRAAGPSSASAIAQGIGCEPPSIYPTLGKDSRFKRLSNGHFALA